LGGYIRRDMKTSNFSSIGRNPDDFKNGVSIALRSPKWWWGRRYPALAPRPKMLKMDEAA
jgi:hypothetical protein